MSRNWPRVGSPSPGFSTLITSAPNHARICVQVGPDCTWVISKTRTPSKAFPIFTLFLKPVVVRCEHIERFEIRDYILESAVSRTLHAFIRVVTGGLRRGTYRQPPGSLS